MSLRKKRMVFMVAAVAVCAAVFFVLVMFIHRKNESENRKRYKALEGVWESEDGKFSMKVRRVSGAHIVFSLERDKNVLDRATAYAVGEDQYEFPYSVSHILMNEYKIQYGGDCKGYINLEDSSLRVDIPAVEGKKNAIEFQGELRKKKEVSEEDAVKEKTAIQLMDYMGTDKQVPKSLRKRCVFEEGKNGVARIFVALEGVTAEEDLYNCALGPVNQLCFESDCEANLGRAESETEFAGGEKKKIYRKDGYMYVILFAKNGLVSHVECRRLDGFDGEFEGDFLCQGDTLVRYMGNFVLGEKMEIPASVNRIAAGAFTAKESMYYGVVKENKLTVPAGVEVEPGAFQACGKWTLTLGEGWTTVPREAFGYMISQDESSIWEESNVWEEQVKSWVTVNLPKSMRRLEERAFYPAREESVRQVLEMVEEQPVRIYLNDGLEYIGDEALWGVQLINGVPEGVKYIGTGNLKPDLKLPDSVEELADGAVNSDSYYGYCEIDLPASLKKMGESAFEGKSISYLFRISSDNRYFTCDEGGNLWSYDKTVLYYSGAFVDKYLGGIDDNPFENSSTTKGKKRAWRDFVVPKGTQVLCKHSLDVTAGPANARIYLPESVKKINRYSLYQCGAKSRIIFAGGVPEFTGEISFGGFFGKDIKIQVKPEIRDEFVEKLLEGQNLMPGQKKKIEKCVVTD